MSDACCYTHLDQRKSPSRKSLSELGHGRVDGWMRPDTEAETLVHRAKTLAATLRGGLEIRRHKAWLKACGARASRPGCQDAVRVAVISCDFAEACLRPVMRAVSSRLKPLRFVVQEH